MQLQWTFTGCDRPQEEEVVELWRQRQSELEAKLGEWGAEEMPQLRLDVEHEDASPAWTVRAGLYVAADAFASEEQGNDLGDLLDRVVGQLSQEIDEREERGEEVVRGRRGLEGVVPFLESFHRNRRSREFAAFLLPVLDTFRSYARRELGARHAAGEIPAGQVVVGELLDEALLRAWDRFDRRPKDRSLDLWLVQLIDEAIEEAAGQNVTESLDERQPRVPAEEPYDLAESMRDESREQVDEMEEVKLSDLIPDEPGVDAWDALAVETKRTQLDRIFATLPRLQRQALMLHLVEGFNKVEVADFQARPVETVDEDIAVGVEALRRNFRDLELEDVEERLERPALERPRRAHRT